MNICFLEGDMSRKGGTERMTAWLANELSNRHNTYIVSLKMEEASIFYPLKDSVNHIVISPTDGKLRIIRQIINIRRLLCIHSIDIVINVDIGMSIYGIPASWGLNKKVITWEHANYYNNWNSKIFPYFRRFAAKKSNAMVVLTEQDRQNYITNIPSKVPVYVIPNPVEKREISYSVDSKIILSAGALLPIKGYDRVIKVAKNLLPQYPDWKWIICGEGPERPALEKMISEAGLTNQVLLAGTVRDMESKYKTAAMMVMTSHMEGLPMVLLEAKSYGIPLISFDIMTGPRDIIKDGINGYLIPANDIDGMVIAVKSLIENGDKRREFSECSQMYMEKFNSETIINIWEALIKH